MHSMSTLRFTCIGLLHINVMSHPCLAKRSAHKLLDAMQWSLNAAAAAIATLLEVSQPSLVLNPGLICAMYPAEYCLTAASCCAELS